MAFTGNFTCNSFRADLFNGTTDFSSTTTYKIALYTNNATLNASTTVYTTVGEVAAYPNPATTGIPKYYALFDSNTFILGPTPAANYAVELHYFYAPESIVTAGTTWLGDNFDSALLYGALCEAATFMKAEPDMVATYNKRYEEAMILAKRLGDGMDRRDAYRSGQVRLSVN